MSIPVKKKISMATKWFNLNQASQKGMFAGSVGIYLIFVFYIPTKTKESEYWHINAFLRNLQNHRNEEMN